MSQSCQSDFDFSDVEGDDYSELDLGYGGDGKVLPREFAMVGGSNDDGEDDTVVSETSWNDPSDVTEDLRVDDVKGASFRRQECEGTYFNPSIVFGYWKNVKALTSAKLPNCYANHHSYLDLQFPKSSFQQNTALFNAIGSVSNSCQTQVHSFLAASFLSVSVGPKAAASVGLISEGSLFPQFSAPSGTRSKFQCQICIPFQKWAQEHITCARLKSKTATQEQIAKGTAHLLFSGLRQVYEHAISKSHKEAIAFFLDKSDKSLTPQGKKSQQKKDEKPGKLQSSLHSFFGTSHSLN